ncbi:CRISPR system precrRNA processing endoribonuclease RAMP protein Cas6 [Desulfonema magnum]|uniref:CRISPR-associated endoribonuclease Cas6 C-terminal domain-containing protein n=1 Tax=Desulfonema magnum TaxID=45655 RepID=A0A975BVB8_9BACT|nr:CRISPR system precrRNA processing endoribonuclease RAMP protein Cas6 [Desulfonema magnum]QTA91968.1 CRISPR-associated endoribonuclease Cas6 C-terminal domain-containing protein [Desulfonema magnum]
MDQTSAILSPFSFAVFRLTIEAIEPLHLPPFKGSAIRGSFGLMFRRVVCPLTRTECGDCHLSEECVYSYIFETFPPKDDPFIRNKDQASHPYILRPPLDGKEEYEPGEELMFELVLVGRAVEYLPYFAYTFIHAGKRGLGRGRGQFFLKRIDSLDMNGTLTPVYLDADQLLRNETIHISCGELLERRPPPDQCTFRFVTRLEIKAKGKYPEITFGLLFRSLMRRITTLAYLHGGIDKCREIDFRGLSHAAEEIRTVSSDLYREDAVRYSNRQKQRMPFGGMLGEITFEGDMSPFWPFLLPGEWVHVGKKTSFGLGQYVLD